MVRKKRVQRYKFFFEFASGKAKKIKKTAVLLHISKIFCIFVWSIFLNDENSINRIRQDGADDCLGCERARTRSGLHH